MMVLLDFDVLTNFVQLRKAHAERAVFFLPGKEPLFEKRLVNPLGRTALDQLHRLGNRKSRWQGEQDVDVVLRPADRDGFHFVLPRDAAQERPKSLAKRRGDKRTAFFRAEDAMKIGTDVRHARHS